MIVIPDFLSPEESVLVLNEGNFQWGNSSTTLINFKTGELTNNLFESLNSRPLGDVLNSFYKDEELFLVLNNSQKIERMKDPLTIAHSPIEGFQSPRYIAKSNQGYYVTDLYSNKLYHLNTSFQIQNEIPLVGWGEQMQVWGSNQLLVCNLTSNFLMKLNTESDQWIDSVQVGDSPRNIVLDSQNRIWVLCEGKVYPNESAGSIWCINPDNLEVLFSHTFTTTSHPTRLQIKPLSNDTIYYLLNGVNRFSAGSFDIPSSPYIPENGRLFYGLGVELSGNIWVSDAKDYVQQGDVYRFNAVGNQLSKYQVGIIPSGFVFY
ncbi:MAG: hypothetical protein WED33_02555 [Bacteroidia bacterium]